MCETHLALTIKTPEWRKWRRSGVRIVNFQQVPHIVLCVSIADFEKVNAGRVE